MLSLFCKHRMRFPKAADNKVHCLAYHNSIRKDGKEWGHFPLCKNKNCPLRHPELLKGAELK